MPNSGPNRLPTTATLSWGSQTISAERVSPPGVQWTSKRRPLGVAWAVVQPFEFYRTRRDPDRVVPIFYSLGNLITPFRHSAFRRSAIARLDIVKGMTREGTSRTYVRDARIVDVRLDVDDVHERLTLRRISQLGE